MSDHDLENFLDGEWEDRGELAWNEFDWQKYLRQNDQEVASFLAFYQQLKHNPNHLDEVAFLMGWGEEEWAPADGESLSSAAGIPFLANEAASADLFNDELEDEVGAYTIHKHPVFVATRGLCQYFNQAWDRFLSSGQGTRVNASLAWKFAASLHAGEFNSIMAIHALDIGDFTLAICHLKNALSSVNHSLSLLQRREENHHDSAEPEGQE
jgi:hypothetical protein